MINVDVLYNRLQDLTRKGKASYFKNDEFNRNMNDAEELLFGYYIELYKNSRWVEDAIKFTLLEAEIANSSGVYPLPSNYKLYNSVAAKVLSGTKGNYKVSKKPAYENKDDESYLSEDNALRRGDVAKRRFSYEVGASDITMFPSDFTGNIYLKYFRDITKAVRGVTIVAGTDEEAYDAGSSTDLEWDPRELPNLIDIMLYLFGMSARDTAVMQWVQSKKSVSLIAE